MIDVTVPADKNTSLKVFQKLCKYKDLEIEVIKMQKLKTKTIPVAIGALGMTKKGTQKILLIKSLVNHHYRICRN